MERTIVVGDIHGCYVEFMDLLGNIGLTQGDRIICVGDLITKGPGNREVLDFVRKRENCQSLLGNHEYILLRHHRGINVKLKPEHTQAVQELGGDFADCMEWVAQLPLYLDLGDHLVVHAGIRPDRSMEDQTLEDLTELRSLDGPEPGSRHGTPWFERYQGHKVVIFGHWVFDSPLLRDNAVGIDTGCVYGGRLTAVVLPEARLVSVPARKAYANKAGG
jgi:diadenosine tetraphosphatase ApaH/serine/threonine PP2A family protein phosphatase